MSDRRPTTDRGRIRIVGFEDADSDRPGDANSNGDGDESPAATAGRTARPTADPESRTGPTAAARSPSGTALEGPDAPGPPGRGSGSAGIGRRWPG